MSRDLFSGHAADYARFRPAYPRELIEYIVSFTNKQTRAWDAATGNGQAATLLSDYFVEVYATDISVQQLQQAAIRHNIHYSQGQAEQTSFPSAHFDLVTIAQAYHWVDPGAFRKEVIRVLRPGGVIAVWGYGLLRSGNDELNQVIGQFYREVTGPYWEKERRHVDESYNSLEFDYELLPSKEFFIETKWALAQFTGYLQSWSAVRKMMSMTQKNPVEDLKAVIKKFWDQEALICFHFPIFLKLGRIEKPAGS